VGPCSQVKGTERSMALGLRPLTTQFSVWVRGGAEIRPIGREKASICILDGGLEELEKIGVHSSHDLLTSEMIYFGF
jgi:hypothetical protein